MDKLTSISRKLEGWSKTMFTTAMSCFLEMHAYLINYIAKLTSYIYMMLVINISSYEHNSMLHWSNKIEFFNCINPKWHNRLTHVVSPKPASQQSKLKQNSVPPPSSQTIQLKPKITNNIIKTLAHACVISGCCSNGLYMCLITIKKY